MNAYKMALWVAALCVGLGWGCVSEQPVETPVATGALSDFVAMAAKDVPQPAGAGAESGGPPAPAARTLTPEEKKEIEAWEPPAGLTSSASSEIAEGQEPTGMPLPPTDASLLLPPEAPVEGTTEEPRMVYYHRLGEVVPTTDKDGVQRFVWLYRLRYRGGVDVTVTINDKTGTIKKIDRPEVPVEDIIAQLKKYLEDGESVESYKALNALVITVANYSRIDELGQILGILDVPRRQVSIEAKVVEISGDTELQWGISHLFRRLGRSTIEVETSLHSEDYVGAGGTMPPYAGSIIDWPTVITVDGKVSVDAIIDLLAREGSLRVISSPHMVVEEGKTASLLAGEKVPLVSFYAVGGQQYTSTQLTDVGAKLWVTPMSISEESVRMHVITEVSQWKITTVMTPPQPVVTIKQARTHVEVRDGGTMIIGGLTSERELESRTKVPLLGDIPVLKYLFSSLRRRKETVELVIFVTPRITQGPMIEAGLGL